VNNLPKVVTQQMKQEMKQERGESSPIVRASLYTKGLQTCSVNALAR